MENKPVEFGSQASLENAKTQRERLLHMLRKGPVTTLMARAAGIMSPAPRILELRRQGHNIVTDRTQCGINAVAGIAKYRLLPEIK